MATSSENSSARAATAKRNTTGPAIRLVPVDNSDRAVVSNVTALQITPGMAFVDFGFLEPAMIAALQRASKEGDKLPERLDGKLAVRVAMSYDAMSTLHQQLGRALNGIAASASGNKQQAGKNA